jgi:hypothetical protein
MTSGARGEGIFGKRKGEGAAGPKGGGARGWAARRPTAGREGGRLGRREAHAGGKGGGRLGRKWGRREGGRKKRFPFSKIYFPLNECIHIFKQSKGMHGPTWCITQNKIF